MAKHLQGGDFGVETNEIQLSDMPMDIGQLKHIYSPTCRFFIVPLADTIMISKGGVPMDVKQRLQDLMDERGWTIYRLAKEAGIPWSTIRNAFKRGTEPSISTLEALCGGLGISLAHFFNTDDSSGLTHEQQEILHDWNLLDPESKEAIEHIIKILARRK